MNEHTLDELFKLQAARTSEIKSAGTVFSPEFSSKEFRAVINGDGSLTAEPNAVVGKFQVLNSAKGSFMVLGIEAQAGRLQLKAVALNGKLQVHELIKTGDDPVTRLPVHKLRQKFTQLPYSLKYSEYRVQPGCVSVGDLVTVCGSQYKVVGKSPSTEGLDRLNLQPYTAPGTQPQKSLAESYAWNSGATTRNPSTAFKIG